MITQTRYVSNFIEIQKIKVDCILTDPPYCISRKNNFKTMGRAGIDFGKWDYNFNQTEWIKNCVPFLNDGGSILFLTIGKIFLILWRLWKIIAA